MAVEHDIMEALFECLGGLVLSPAHPIAWPNVKFEPPADQRFLRAGFVPNTANRVLIDSDGPHRHMGLLQVSVYGPKGQGEATLRALAGEVADRFPADLRLGSLPVRITKRPDVADLIIEDARVQIPVLVSWECWA